MFRYLNGLSNRLIAQELANPGPVLWYHHVARLVFLFFLFLCLSWAVSPTAAVVPAVVCACFLYKPEKLNTKPKLQITPIPTDQLPGSDLVDVRARMWTLLNWFMHLPTIPEDLRGTPQANVDLARQETLYRYGLCMLFGVDYFCDIEIHKHIKVAYTPKWVLGERAFTVNGFYFEYENQGSTESVTYCGLTGRATFSCSNGGKLVNGIPVEQNTITNEDHLLEACKGFCDYLTEEFNLLTVCNK